MGADRKLANWDKLPRTTRCSRRARTRSSSSSSASRAKAGLRGHLHLVAGQPRASSNTTADRRSSSPIRAALSEAEVKKLIAEGKAVTIQSFALHSGEVAASQAAAEFVYDWLTPHRRRGDAQSRQRHQHRLPSINPDGTQMIADWYMKYVGTAHEAAGLPWLYQKYSGHDNNRDGFALNLPESQHIGKLMYRDWLPQAYMDHHQMGSGNARLFIPPYAEPIRPDGDPLVWREITWFGGHMGTKLEAAGKTGVIGAAIYSGWGHMGFHWITPFHNIAGMLNESASARLATPLFQHPDQLRGGTRGLPEYASQTTMPSLWPGGWWRVRDIVENQKIVAWSIVDLAARNRETLLSNMYLKASRQSERGLTQPVKAYAIAADQHDPQTVKKLANMLMDSGVEVQQTKAQFDRRRPRLRPGLVRRLDGAAEAGPGALDAGPHVLSRQHLHARPARAIRSARTTCPPTRSASSWACAAIRSARRSGRSGQADRAGADDRHGAASAPNGYVLDGRLNDSFRAVFLLLDKGVAVRRAPAGVGRQRQDRRLPRRRPATSPRLRSRPASTSSRSSRRWRRAPIRFASRASRCCSATAAATWTRAGRA